MSEHTENYGPPWLDPGCPFYLVSVPADAWVHPRALVGSPAFTYDRKTGERKPQNPKAGVVLSAGVEVFPFANIDRGTERDTFIGGNTKIDHYVHVGHDVRVGARCYVCAGAVLMGFVEVGDDCFIGVGAIVRNRIRIGHHVKIGAGAVVVEDVPDGVVIAGVPTRVLRSEW